jgi:hypothetical protein
MDSLVNMTEFSHLTTIVPICCYTDNYSTKKRIILEINSKIKQILTLVNISLKRDFRNGKLAYRF